MKLYNEDFFINADKIQDESIDLIVTDPPYLIGYGNNDWDKHEFVEFTERWVDIVLKKLKPTGTMWSCMARENSFTHKYCKKGFVNILQERGTVHLENWSVWARQKGRGSSKHLKSQREEIFHFTKDENTYVWNNLKMLREVIAPYVKDGRPRGWFLDENGKRVRWTGLGNVWTYSAPQFNGISEPQFHPSQKPIMLMERLIQISSNEGDLVLDPFMGSGTTAIACKLSNRNFIGFEVDEKYFKFASDRLNSFDVLNYPGYNLSTDIQIVEKMKKINTKITNREKNHIKSNISKNPEIKNNFF